MSMPTPRWGTRTPTAMTTGTTTMSTRGWSEGYGTPIPTSMERRCTGIPTGRICITGMGIPGGDSDRTVGWFEIGR